MQKFSGVLHKMKTTLAEPVHYELIFGEQAISLNEFLNKNLSLTISGHIFCIQCGRKTAKSFQQGYCYPCMLRLQECNLCMIHPERCLVESGKCDPNDWAHSHCTDTHVVYLANASSLKVGITREKNLPYRWIDQGAIQALPIFKVPHRALVGKVEVAFKQYVADKTNWRVMLKNEAITVDLVALRDELLKTVEKDLSILHEKHVDQIEFIKEGQVQEIQYPVLQYPNKIVSLSFEKTPQISGKLMGIKGQYLIFDVGVINIRKYGGYEVILEGE